MSALGAFSATTSDPSNNCQSVTPLSSPTGTQTCAFASGPLKQEGRDNERTNTNPSTPNCGLKRGTTPRQINYDGPSVYDLRICWLMDRDPAQHYAFPKPIVVLGDGTALHSFMGTRPDLPLRFPGCHGQRTTGHKAPRRRDNSCRCCRITARWRSPFPFLSFFRLAANLLFGGLIVRHAFNSQCAYITHRSTHRSKRKSPHPLKTPRDIPSRWKRQGAGLPPSSSCTLNQLINCSAKNGWF